MFIRKKKLCLDRLAVSIGVTVIILFFVNLPIFLYNDDGKEAILKANKQLLYKPREAYHHKKHFFKSQRKPTEVDYVNEELDAEEVNKLRKEILVADTQWMNQPQYRDGSFHSDDDDAAQSYNKVKLRLDREKNLYPHDMSWNVIRNEDDTDVDGKRQYRTTKPPNKGPEDVEETEEKSTHRSYDLVFWSQDYDAASVLNLKLFFKTRGVQIIDKSLSSKCSKLKNCGANLKVVNASNGLTLSRGMIAEFYKAYRNSPEMDQSDAYICINPMSMCELFEPFKKPMVMIANSRYDMGRDHLDSWHRWNSKLFEFSKQSQHVIAATNYYDVLYTRYYTGVTPLYLPQHCGYVHKRYTPKYTSFLLAPVKNIHFKSSFLRTVKKYQKLYNVTLLPVEDIYRPYKLSHVISYRAMVFIPSKVSQLRFTEIYRTDTPLFVPSYSLLCQWQEQYRLVRHKVTARGKWAESSNESQIDGMQNVPDPNNESDMRSIKYWMKRLDVYNVPHITYFNSIEDLVNLLARTTPRWLNAVSVAMADANRQIKLDIEKKWDKIFSNIEETIE